MEWTDEDRTPPMRRIKYEVGHAISGYTSDNPPAYFINLRQARAYAVEEVDQYLESEDAFDGNGKRYRPGHDNHITVTKEGPHKWRLTRPMGWSRYVYVADVDEALYFDADGEVWERKEDGEGDITWEHVNLDW